MAEQSGLDAANAGGPAAMTMPRLLEERRAKLGRGESAMEETIELHRKLVLPVAALLLPFVGLPLGALGRRGVKSRGLVLSTMVVLVYYLLLTGAVTVAREEILPVAVAMWIPDLLLAVFAAALFQRVSSERPFAMPIVRKVRA
jgi:lipopolysaccharide export LptBFGC system permease protein LptF